MHNYPLYHPVSAECLCCHFTYDAEFKSKADQVVCPTCARHQGTSPQTLEHRDRDHSERARRALEDQHEVYERRLELMRQQCDAYRAELDVLRDEVDELKSTIAAGIAATPPESVQHWWETEAIREAQAKRDAAYRSRDYAYRSLWYLDDIHHHDEGNDRKCSCGRAATACKELLVLDDIVDGLDRWVKNQIERLEQGKEHGLPRDHPLVTTGTRSGSWGQYSAAR